MAKVKCKRCKTVYWTEKHSECPECGKKPPKGGALGELGKAMALILVVICVIIALVNGYEEKGDESLLGKLFSSADKVTISWEEYSQLRDGMTYEQCKKIIGGKGMLYNEQMISGLADYTYYYWPGETIVGHAILGFANDRLVFKEQTALRTAE